MRIMICAKHEERLEAIRKNAAKSIVILETSFFEEILNKNEWSEELKMTVLDGALLSIESDQKELAKHKEALSDN